MDPELPPRTVTLAFPHSWKAEILPKRPLEVMVQPTGNAVKFLATFALGFADPATPTGLWSCPGTDDLCAVAGGYAYIVNTLNPQQFKQIAFRPVLEVRPLPEHALLLFAGHHALLAWGPVGQRWVTLRLSSEGLRITALRGDELHGVGWDLLTDRELPFTIDLRTGENIGPHPGSVR
jgi:hypothetical protein